MQLQENLDKGQGHDEGEGNDKNGEDQIEHEPSVEHISEQDEDNEVASIDEDETEDEDEEQLEHEEDGEYEEGIESDGADEQDREEADEEVGVGEENEERYVEESNDEGNEEEGHQEINEHSEAVFVSDCAEGHCDDPAESSLNPELQIPGPTCYFKLVGDNIDKNVKPRYMRSDNQTKSLHYFHVYAVEDRVNSNQMSNQMHMIDPKMVDLDMLLPSNDDGKIMETNFCTLISRVLVKHMKHLHPYASSINQHILHKYSEEMSQKSKVVSVNYNMFM